MRAEKKWKKAPAEERHEMPPLGTASKVALYSPIILLAAIIVIIGLAVQPFLILSARAADQLLDPGAYIAAVLENR